MRYYSTSGSVKNVSLREAVINGLAADNGLFMPDKIIKLPNQFLEQLENYTFQEIAVTVALAMFGQDIEPEALTSIVYDTLAFDCPVMQVSENIFSLELFHGPTLAFKDVGARFMARVLQHFLKDEKKDVHVLVATSGDTGSAVANGFLGVEGIKVHVLYPKGRVSEIQEKQFTTLGKNIIAYEVSGVFDDCQNLVKTAFLDEKLNSRMMLTSANSINIARFMPQAFYYFNAAARLKEKGYAPENLVFSVPSGNFGNLTAGLVAMKMGLPVKRFIAANNANDIVYNYLRTGKYEPKSSIETIANAMDVGNPSNFVRILDMFENSYDEISATVSGNTYTDDQIRVTILQAYEKTGYLLDPHGACSYQALNDGLGEGEVGVFLETAHPAKFQETVTNVVGKKAVSAPERLRQFKQGQKRSIEISNDFDEFKSLLQAAAS